MSMACIYLIGGTAVTVPVEDGWPAAWSRTALPTAILAVLESSARHGYALAAELESRGFGRPRGGSLYPLLGRLEADGLIVSTWEPGGAGPGRRTYSLTPKGSRLLACERSQWAALTAALDGPAAPDHQDGPEPTTPLEGP